MRWALDTLYLLALTLLSPWLAWRAWRTKRYRQGLRDKLLGLSHPLPPGAVWFHAVSLGEVKVLGQFVHAFRQRHPTRSVVVSSTTDTGLAEARKLFPDLIVFPFPFDFSRTVTRTLRQVQPSLVVLCESELWPNFLLAAKRMHVPVAVVNGRMSPRSLNRYLMIRPLVRWMFRSLAVAGVQTDEHVAALLALGGMPGQVVRTGNVKYDGALTDPHHPKIAELRRFYALAPRDLTWVVGSTQPPEEEIALAIYLRAKKRYPQLRLFVVPRQPDRFDEVARLLERKGLSYVRRSRLHQGERGAEPAASASERGGEDNRGLTPPARPVVLVDTVGELSHLWALADVAFVGGSLDGKRGGQNMIEPAAFAAAVTFGPHVWNFQETARRLVEVGGAYQVRDAAELEAVTLRLLGDPQERRAAGAEARRFVLAQQGATQRTLGLLDTVLPASTSERAA